MDERVLFDRRRLVFAPLSTRRNLVSLAEIAVPTDIEGARDTLDSLPRALRAGVERCAAAIAGARNRGRPVVCAFGAHAIKNGLGPLLAAFAETGLVNHFATNGAGVIHDWEIAHQGATSEDVRENAPAGRFGMWEETGFSINAALLVGAWRGSGYGESVGDFIAGDGTEVPSADELERTLRDPASPHDKAAAAADLLDAIARGLLKEGRIVTAHPYKEASLHYRARRAGLPFTSHPMIGHDIIYAHPLSSGAAIGRTAERDFLCYAASIAEVADGGVYLSVGSAVMSPMIFEKSFSMAMNLARTEGRSPRGHDVFVVDIQEGDWDWRNGEPPPTDPGYYRRFMKTFARMGGRTEYLCLDNRAFFLSLWALLGAGGESRYREERT